MKSDFPHMFDETKKFDKIVDQEGTHWHSFVKEGRDSLYKIEDQGQ